MPVSEGFINETRAFWQRRTGIPVSADDAREAARNVARFVELLAEWERAEGRAESGADVIEDAPGDGVATRPQGG